MVAIAVEPKKDNALILAIEMASKAVNIYEARNHFHTGQAASYERQISNSIQYQSDLKERIKKLEADAAQNVEWRMELREQIVKLETKLTEAIERAELAETSRDQWRRLYKNLLKKRRK